MAEKLFTNVRLGLKVDTLTNWKSSSLVLKKGEVAFATAAATAGNGLTEPVCMMKIGDGEHTFSELGFDFYAKASDVLAACKSEDTLKAFVNSVIADAGIASDEAMQELAGRVTTAEGKITTLENDLNTAETGLKARMATAEGAIDALEDLVGDTKVATQITNAINALDLANTYEAKGEAAKVQSDLDTYKTSNDAAVQKNATDIAGEIARAKAAEEANAGAITAIKDGTTIDSFADVEAALAGKQATGDYATKTEAQGYADAKDADIAAAKKAGEDAAAAVDGKLTAEVERATAAEAKALEDAQKYTDAEIKEWVGEDTVAEQISTAIAAEKLAETYAPISHKHVKADITDFAHTHEIGEVNGLQDALDGKQAVGDYATKEEAQGYADAKDEAIAAALKAGQDAQGEVDALETYVGTIPEDEKYADITSVIGFINKKAEETLAAASGNSTETAASVKAALDTYKTENNAAVKANADAIDALEVLVGDTAVATQIADAVAEEAEIARAAEKANADAIKAIGDDYLKTADKTELTEAIATAKQEAVATVLGEGVDEDFDTLKEVADWILSDTTGAAALQTDVATIKADYLKAADKTELEGKITTAQNAADAAQGEVDALEGVVATKAAQADLEALAGRVTTVEGDLNTEATGLKARMTVAEADIDALQGKVGDKDVATQINEAIAAENLSQYALASDLDTAEGKIEVLEGKAHEHANAEELAKFVDGDKAKLDTAVQSVTAGVGLKAVKTGTDVAIDLDEAVTFIFDCGGADVE